MARGHCGIEYIVKAFENALRIRLRKYATLILQPQRLKYILEYFRRRVLPTFADDEHIIRIHLPGVPDLVDVDVKAGYLEMTRSIFHVFTECVGKNSTISSLRHSEIL